MLNVFHKDIYLTVYCKKRKLPFVNTFLSFVNTFIVYSKILLFLSRFVFVLYQKYHNNNQPTTDEIRHYSHLVSSCATCFV